MKLNFNYLLALFLMLFCVVPVLALQEVIPDVTDPNQLVSLLAAPITWLAVEGAKKLVGALGGSLTGGWILALVVPGLSALGAYLITLLEPDASYIATLLIGLGSTFIDQAIKKLKGE